MSRTTAPEDQPTRYDGIADGYARWWAPVIAPAAVALLDHVRRAGAGPDRAPARVVDIGTGTGTLAVEALRRWPAATVVGVDASGEMAARARADVPLRAPDAASRFDAVVAPAERMPFPDASFDLALSSFVFQLVPSRPRALREARRVLAPGGTAGWVTWLESDRPFAPDAVVDDVLEEFGFDRREPDDRPGDVPSVGAAVRQMRRAGFVEADAVASVLEHRWTPEGYLGFVEHFDEASTFDELGRDLERARRMILDRLARLAEGELTLELPIVYVVGRTGSGSAGLR